MTKVRIHQGTEGPSHDPYGYMEIDVTRNGHTFTLHAGLVVYVEVDGRDREQLYGNDYQDGGRQRFIMMTGCAPELWEKWYERSKMRCNDCGCKKCKPADGTCARCGGLSTYQLEEMYNDAYRGYI
jgi:hypothetical protein